MALGYSAPKYPWVSVYSQYLLVSTLRRSDFLLAIFLGPKYGVQGYSGS